MVQCLRIHLAMQGMQVWSLVRELRSHMWPSTKPTHCNYWACTTIKESIRRSERPCMLQLRPKAAKLKKNIYIYICERNWVRYLTNWDKNDYECKLGYAEKEKSQERGQPGWTASAWLVWKDLLEGVMSKLRSEGCVEEPNIRLQGQKAQDRKALTDANAGKASMTRWDWRGSPPGSLELTTMESYGMSVL